MLYRSVVFGIFVHFCTSTVTLSNIGVVACDALGCPALAVGLLFDLMEVADALLLAFEPRRELPKNKRPNHSVNLSTSWLNLACS